MDLQIIWPEFCSRPIVLSDSWLGQLHERELFVYQPWYIMHGSTDFCCDEFGNHVILTSNDILHS